jgi:putative Mg2+ transporter-C (MgtC) family protein
MELNIGPIEQEFLKDLGIALLCGLIIGIEREIHKKPAGISTQTLVISASMLFTFISSIVSEGDNTRIAAQIVSGIGFLGAGLIIKSEAKEQVSNVTTAASIWYAAAIGMAIGFNLHFLAITGAVFVTLVTMIPRVEEIQKYVSKSKNRRKK